MSKRHIYVSLLELWHPCEDAEQAAQESEDVPEEVCGVGGGAWL
jgi:hypothetical protein